MEDRGFEACYREHRDRTVAALWALCGDRRLAEDATAEAFARALARWERVGTMERPGGWVTTVALNVMRRTLRRRSMERAVLRRRPSGVAHEDHPPDMEVWSAVRRLPPRQRQAVALRYAADLSEEEVAAVMGVKRGTVASSLAAARKQLAVILAVEEAPRG